jgi:hypothetical protein
MRPARFIDSETGTDFVSSHSEPMSVA